MKKELKLTVNGEPYEVLIEPRTTNIGIALEPIHDNATSNEGTLAVPVGTIVSEKFVGAVEVSKCIGRPTRWRSTSSHIWWPPMWPATMRNAGKERCTFASMCGMEWSLENGPGSMPV
jgi:hypothetical protein